MSPNDDTRRLGPCYPITRRWSIVRRFCEREKIGCTAPENTGVGGGGGRSRDNLRNDKQTYK
jgi:hypothetical protein